MKENKNIWLSEFLQMVKAPTYFTYWLGLFLVYAHQYLPVLYGNKNTVITDPDSFAYAAARRFGNCFGAFLLIFPAFIIATSLLRDMKMKKLRQIDVREGQPVQTAVVVRYITQVALLFLPVLVVATIAAVNLEKTAELETVVSFAERLHYYEICFVWLLPVILAVTAVVTFLLELTQNCFVAIMGQVLVWIFTSGSTGEVGDYNSCLAIRHTYFGGYDILTANAGALAVNRIVVVLIALMLVMATVAVYGSKQGKQAK